MRPHYSLKKHKQLMVGGGIFFSAMATGKVPMSLKMALIKFVESPKQKTRGPVTSKSQWERFRGVLCNVWDPRLPGIHVLVLSSKAF